MYVRILMPHNECDRFVGAMLKKGYSLKAGFTESRIFADNDEQNIVNTALFIIDRADVPVDKETLAKDVKAVLLATGYSFFYVIINEARDTIVKNGNIVKHGSTST